MFKKIFQYFKKLFTKRSEKVQKVEKNTETPQKEVEKNTQQVETVTPFIEKDEDLYLSVRLQGREIKNTFVSLKNRSLKLPIFEKYWPKCVQYNNKDLSDIGEFGEVTVFKDSAPCGEKVVELPKNIKIDKVVCWYEVM
jgi:hypothetical protein